MPVSKQRSITELYRDPLIEIVCVVPVYLALVYPPIKVIYDNHTIQ